MVRYDKTVSNKSMHMASVSSQFVNTYDFESCDFKVIILQYFLIDLKLIQSVLEGLNR